MDTCRLSVPSVIWSRCVARYKLVKAENLGLAGRVGMEAHASHFHPIAPKEIRPFFARDEPGLGDAHPGRGRVRKATVRTGPEFLRRILYAPGVRHGSRHGRLVRPPSTLPKGQRRSGRRPAFAV